MGDVDFYMSTVIYLCKAAEFIYLFILHSVAYKRQSFLLERMLFSLFSSVAFSFQLQGAIFMIKLSFSPTDIHFCCQERYGP